MTIRFQCGSCSQPIEVDDEWSAKPVACPYCRKTVTAPIESTLGDPGAFQAAVPVALGPPDDDPFPPMPGAVPGIPSKNRIALVALFLAIGAMGMLVAGQSILGAHPAAFERLTQATENARTSAESSQALNEFLQAYPDAYNWLLPAIMLLLGGAATSVAAIVCGIIGSRRRARRGLAIAALAIGFLPILLCLGSAVG